MEPLQGLTADQPVTPAIGGPTVAVAAAAVSAGDGRRRLVVGAFAYGARQIAMTLLGLGANLAITRLLLPEDFGRIAAVNVILGLLKVLTVGGLGVYLVQRTEEITDQDLCAVVSLQFALYAALQALAFVAILASIWFRIDRLLCELLAVALCALPFGVFRSGSMIILERRLDFAKMAMIEVAEQLVVTVVMVSLALAGARAWSVVVGGVAGALMSWRLAHRVSPYRLQLRWPELTPSLKAGVTFSAQVLAPALVGTARVAAIPIVLGGMVGFAAVGFAERATFIATFPASLLGGIQQKILFSFTARIQENRSSVRRVIEEATYVSTSLDKILYIPLAAFAPALIHYLLTDKWLPAAPLVEVIAWAGAAAAGFQGVAPPMLNAVGEAKVIAIMNVVMLVLTWMLLAPFVHWAGLMGYAYLTVVLYLTAPYLYYLMRRRIGDFHVVRSVTSSFVGFAITVLGLRAAARHWFPEGPTVAQLVELTGTGMLFYCAFIIMVDRHRFLRILAAVRVRGRKVAATTVHTSAEL